MDETQNRDLPEIGDTRHLIHEIKNQLYIINMGLEVLRGARQNEEEFTRIVASIRCDGLEPLKSTLAALIERASQVRTPSTPKQRGRSSATDRK